MRDPNTGRFLSTEDALRQNMIEVFHVPAQDFLSSWRSADGTWMAALMDERLNDGGEDPGDHNEAARLEAVSLQGWYWWTCVPGCLPDSDAFGPFPTERKAAHNALEGLD